MKNATMNSSTKTAITALRSAQIAILLITGAVLWFLAALIVRYFGPIGAFAGIWWFIAYAVAIPVTAVFIWTGWRLAGLVRAQVLVGATIMTGIATLLDAVALSWFRTLYGTDDTIILGGAAYILWGVGLALAMATALHETQSTQGPR